MVIRLEIAVEKEVEVIVEVLVEIDIEEDTIKDLYLVHIQRDQITPMNKERIWERREEVVEADKRDIEVARVLIENLAEVEVRDQIVEDHLEIEEDREIEVIVVEITINLVRERDQWAVRDQDQMIGTCIIIMKVVKMIRSEE
jgi:hypothetical protein